MPKLRRRALVLAAVVAAELWFLVSERAAYEAVLFRAAYGVRALTVCYTMLVLLAVTGIACVQFGRDSRRLAWAGRLAGPGKAVAVLLMALGSVLALLSLAGIVMLAGRG
jgi:hypothetical protein